MIRIVLALTLAFAGQAFATPEYILPTLFDVTGVAPDDVLNIRASPAATAPIVGTLAPDAPAVEIIEERNGWGRVITDEGTGWVSMRYLAYRTDVWLPGALPAAFRCLGTEPFWDAHVESGGLVLKTPEDQAGDRRPVQAVLDSGAFRDPARVVLAREWTLLAHPQICSDGMSDRMYGLTATLILRGDQPRMLTGCCLIGP